MTVRRPAELGPRLGPLRSERMLQVLITKINDTQAIKTPFPHIRITNVWVPEFTDRMVVPGNDWPTTSYPNPTVPGRLHMTFPQDDVDNIFADMAFMFSSERLKECITRNFQGVDITKFVGHRTVLWEQSELFEQLPHTGGGIKMFTFMYSAFGENNFGQPPDSPLGQNRLHSQSIHDQKTTQRKPVADMATTLGYQNDRNSIIMFPNTKDSWSSVPLQTAFSGIRREMVHMYFSVEYKRKSRAAQP